MHCGGSGINRGKRLCFTGRGKGMQRDDARRKDGFVHKMRTMSRPEVGSEIVDERRKR